jgi:hypothetical protein
MDHVTVDFASIRPIRRFKESNDLNLSDQANPSYKNAKDKAFHTPNNAIFIISIVFLLIGMTLVMYSIYVFNKSDNNKKNLIETNSEKIPYINDRKYDKKILDIFNTDNVLSLNEVGDDIVNPSMKLNKFKYIFITPTEVNLTENYPKNNDYWEEFLFKNLVEYKFCCFLNDNYFVCSNGRTIEEYDELLIEVFFQKSDTGYPYLTVSVSSVIFLDTQCIINGVYQSEL